MNCPKCQTASKKFGKTSDGRQKFRCRTYPSVMTEPKPRPEHEIRIPRERALLVLSLLCEGSSIRAIERLTGTEKRTVLRLLDIAGKGCERLLERMIANVPVEDVEADELWSYVYCKQGTKERKKIANPEAGDAYCFVGLERTSKLILAWHLGRRNSWDAHDFAAKLAHATGGRFTLSTDGFTAYENAVEYHFGDRVDYGQVIKEFRAETGAEMRRYAPPRLIGCKKIAVSGNPEESKIGTSRVERANWTLRTHLRRLTRLSNGFSRKRENLRSALGLFFGYYNLVKFHGALKMTPGMAAGITTKPWSMGELLDAAVA